VPDAGIAWQPTGNRRATPTTSSSPRARHPLLFVVADEIGWRCHKNAGVLPHVR
jgi:hypothetical protein